MKVHIVTLGCPKNLVDSEATATLLMRSGCTLTENPEEAELMLVGACSFLDASWNETVEEVERLAEFKQSGDKRLVLMGCLPRHRNEDLETVLPDVDHFLPTGGHAKLPELIESWRADKSTSRIVDPAEDRFAGFQGRQLFTPSHTAYVKVAEGCNRKCTFCAIPIIRGRQITRSIGDIVTEVEGHVSNGVKEVTLLAQDIVSYHSDGRKMSHLVDAIANTGIDWIRIFYFHPAGIDAEFVRRILEHDAVCHYLEMPIQHASSRLLDRMNRSHDRNHLEKLIRQIRKNIPGLVIRSEVIAGFPGETDDDFEELKDFVQEFEFDSLGIFPYSREPGTVAATMSDQLPTHVIHDRVEELTAHQDAIAFGARARFEGDVLQILVDRIVDEDDGGFTDCKWAGRFYGQGLDVDGEVYLSSPRKLEVGEFVDARIVDAGSFDLKAVVL